jgi:hypothetical protein
MRKSAVLIALSLVLLRPILSLAETFPDTISDIEFWRLITSLSEEGGRFAPQFMSNEDSYQFVIPGLKDTTQKNGVYIGVGSEQNFTYIAAIRPKLSFIVDIRRDNLLEHLMYKAIFEISKDRADFVSLLFSRKRPGGLASNASAKTLFDAFQTTEPDSAVYEQNLRAVLDRLAAHNFQLSEADIADIGRIMTVFRTAGPYSLKGQGDRTNPTYAQLMSMSDPAGNNQSYLASEENFRTIQKLERENRVIPLVGDFAGNKTIVGIGSFLKQHNAPVNVFYLSNVERYLFDDFAHGKQFYSNTASLPLNSSSTFIRSVTTDISKRLGFFLPAGKEKWRSFLFPIQDCLQRLGDGRIQSYRDLFAKIQ